MAEQVLSARGEGMNEVASRWLQPAMFGTLVAAAVTVIRKHATEPGMPRMSSEWLHSHDRWGGRRWTN
jgi:hypothetical protein